MVYEIAVLNSRKDTNPKPQNWDWSQLVERLRNVTVCTHTCAEYQKMSKAQRLEAKDVGAFIGGKTMKRNVLYRQLLSLDIDEAAADTLPTLRGWLEGKRYVLHSTHSSTVREPRYRVIIPLSRIVTADEHGAIMRLLHDKFALPIDVATLDMGRIMFWPSVPSDAEYLFEVEEGDCVSPDDILAAVPDWRDMSSLTYTPKGQVQDPRKKSGIIGAFCSKFNAREALDNFLTDIWRPERDGSYTLIGASTTSGGKIFDDGHGFVSFHSSDKWQGRTHNAYDLVRLYKFGGEDKISQAAMLTLCDSLGIKATDGKRAAAALEAMDDETAKTILSEQLQYDAKGELKPTIENALLIIDNDPDTRGVFAYDSFSEMPTLQRPPVWRKDAKVRVENEDCTNVREYDEMEDYDKSELRLWLEKKYGMAARAPVDDALKIAIRRNAFHPIRDYLNSLEWDGVKRLSTIFIDCFGVADTPYAREVGEKFFVGAVRRVFIPASKMDYIPVLVSDEGLQKSKFVKRMAKLWGSDTFSTWNGGKDAYEQLRGAWLVEIAELNGVQTRSSNTRKAFITKGSDRYRQAYGEFVKTFKRQCVFIASSNDVVFLDDPSEGGRRWWGMMCNPESITIDVGSPEFLDMVDLYWAEAVHYYRAGVLPMLSRESENEARVLREVHKNEDIESGALVEYLNMPVPEDWGERNILQRKAYFNDERSLWVGKPRDVICTAEVAREFFEIDRKTYNHKEGRRVSDAIRATGLFVQTGHKQRFGEYGLVMAWIRKKDKKNGKTV